MGNRVWYRGESTNWTQPKAGGNIHDFGDGLYVTDKQDVAELYAKTRAANDGGKPAVYMVEFKPEELGRVLDLSTDPRWNKFLDKPLLPGLPDTPRKLIQRQNEAFSGLFKTFLKANDIRLEQYSAVIGPEFVRGGRQLAILSKNGAPSAIAQAARSRMRIVGDPVEVVSLPSVPGAGGAKPGPGKIMTATRAVLSNQDAMALLGVALESFAMWLGDIGNQRRIRADLDKRADSIADSFRRDRGVLVIMWFKEWATKDFNGGRARVYSDMMLSEGISESDAMSRWKSQATITAGPPKGWRMVTQTLWIPPPDEIRKLPKSPFPKLPDPTRPRHRPLLPGEPGVCEK